MYELEPKPNPARHPPTVKLSPSGNAGIILSLGIVDRLTLPIVTADSQSMYFSFNSSAFVSIPVSILV